jgi:hypothetical protein
MTGEAGEPVFTIKLAYAFREFTGRDWASLDGEAQRIWARDFAESHRDVPIELGNVRLGYVVDVMVNDDSVGFILAWSNQVTISTLYRRQDGG